MNGTISGTPNVVAVATAPNYGRFAIGPVEAGLGVPLGNALRRILLSSLPGTAVTSVRIQGIYHEFSSIPFIREDVTEIVLNVKNIRLRSYSERPVRLQLNKYGPGVVRAADIELPANVELVNPELVIANLDNEEAHFEMELTVERGRGYVSFEAREGLAIGMIPVDALFSPIPKVNYLVESANADVLTTALEGEERQEIDPASLHGSEQVLLEIWTDGTMEPGEALSMSAQYLAQHSSLIASFNRALPVSPDRDPIGVNIPAHIGDMSVEDLNLSMRTYNCLKRSGILKVGQVLRMDRKELLSLRNFGEKSFDELYQALESRELLPEGTPLAVSASQPSDTEGSVDGDDGVGDEGDLDDADVGYAVADGDEPDPDAYMITPDGATVQIVDPAGVGDGAVEASAGIYLDGEPASQPIDITADPSSLDIDTTDPAEVEAEASPKSKKKS
ncbi:MAG: DNA-directed RNA polymerase subunit alpha [Chloroflexota bacterium]|nr:DNA-directed RNA polymerase subunit alpha [Chloroflexota bacterium]